MGVVSFKCIDPSCYIHINTIKVLNMRNISLFFGRLAKSLCLAIGLTLAASGHVNAQDAKAGEAIFKANCTTCHLVQGKRVGPELKGMTERYSEEWLIKWIRNSQALIATGDEAAVQIFEEYNRSVMTAFPQLSDDDIRNIIAYVEAEEARLAAGPAAGGDGATGGATAASDDASTFMILGLIVVIVLAIAIIVVLGRVIRTLERVVEKNQHLIQVEQDLAQGESNQAFKKFLKNKKLVGFTVLVLVVILGAFGWNTLWNVGVHQGYQPVQPIKFSHQLHAGVNQIECQYCHGGAFKSKNASIPSANICMNCHKGVTGSEQYGGEISPEIAKIYKALDYDPATGEYGNNPRPIQWIRIHNLPDFAYFNHSQHVVVAGVECQTCHGPVETMEELYQFAPLTMKWCVDCHQNTEVNADNAYYDRLIEAHEKLKKGEKMTAAMIGGLECGKCHY
jgi:mono/diheme cytochrome c family protein